MTNLFALNENLSVKILNPNNPIQKIIIIDDILKQPNNLIAFAAANNFSPYAGHGTGKGYPGLRLTPPSDYSNTIVDFIKPLIRSEFAIPENLEMGKSECALSLMTTKPEELGPLQCVPHFDTSNINQFAVLLYLCGQPHGGTAFYRHNATGLEFITPATKDRYLDMFFAELNEKRPAQQYFSESNERFTKIGFLPAALNRMVIYRSCVIHSPYLIDPGRSINSDPRTGRLTVNTFVAF
ncbi:hypothetical protein GCM10011613_02350 [Cellvibrio zantedeschiae]|uniref:Prolyl 4-hydroxylase alpha subunit Fe(2+) 2OG dioxygenase domain-containing protein n=1 Tax=Cellvibrio zantedeschiae TaxID=1237077 RepID=A0ABQ3AP95_9GAMM|nr:DUF6445 family protein [Cellvibrio zantedeschiae]GGY62395.1 hypothetical protein GCM10011613_02350 [Cellvibrio zantedeschiae]